MSPGPSARSTGAASAIARRPAQVPAAVERHLARLFPGAHIVSARALGADEASYAGAGDAKAAGYGAPLVVELDDRGHRRKLVLHGATANDFGHDRRADRAAELLLAADTFGLVPGHVGTLDVGAYRRDGELVSLAGTGEFYLLTEWAEGAPYAADLRRIARDGAAGPLDEARVDALADWLAALHAKKGGRAAVYRRAVRDLVGSGEGLFGIVDGYPDGTPAAPRERLARIEAAAAGWRWRLRDREHRLARTHGDFHPFNVLFSDGTARLALLDASRGGAGDPADDVTALAVNYPFFALAEGRGGEPLRALHRRFWRRYLDATGDDALLDVAAPFYAWRALVVGNPLFYPALAASARDRLLAVAEAQLSAPRFDLDAIEPLFAG